MKKEVINPDALFGFVMKDLTKSNEIKAWYVIVQMTAGVNKKSRPIENESFIEMGISRRDQVIKSTNELVEKGLIFKIPDLKSTNEHVYRYAINYEGVRIFSEGQNEV